MAKQRIWELDALRGICILGMVLFHLLYDLTGMYHILPFSIPSGLLLLANYGTKVFLLLSGLCVTLGSHPVRRGLIVFAAGMACTFVTWLMCAFGFLGSTMVIRFGVLHCLGICMLLWPLLKKLPLPWLTVLGLLVIGIGIWWDSGNVRVDVQWFFPLGLRAHGFSSGDYFPLFPCLGWFLLGAVLGKTLYHKKQSLLPQPGFTAFFCLCGQHSLPIYLIHQPLFAAILFLLKELL